MTSPGLTPRIQFATTSDGVRIAYATLGDGPPLVYMPEWVSHIEHELSGMPGAYIRRLARAHTVLIYDGRGTGLSDRDASDFSIESRLRDLEAVVEHAGVDQFALFAASQASPVGITYAARNPQRVSKLVLYSPISRSGGDRMEEKSLLRALLDLIRAEWGVGARTTLGFVHPDADPREVEEELTYLRAASSGEVAAAILEQNFFHVDVTEDLVRITAPALVLHRRGDQAVPLELGRRAASLLQNARFVPLEGDHHLPFRGDADSVLRAVEEFLGVESPPERETHPHSHERAAAPPMTILFTDMEGSTALTRRLGDAQAQILVRRHNDIVRGALHSHGGSEIKHTGDGIMASFLSASAGVECAIVIQRALQQHNQDASDDQVRVRIGINVGEPVAEEDDLFGTAVQLARRVCDEAQAGQIIVSNVVRELVAGKGFLFSEAGEAALRGFDDPVRLYQVRWQE